MLLLQNFQPGGPEKFTGADDPRHALSENGGLADFWSLDDGDILCHPELVLPYRAAFLTRQTQKMVQKDVDKTNRSHLLRLRSGQHFDWKISEVRALATVATAVHGNIILGVAVRPRRCIADQLLAKGAHHSSHCTSAFNSVRIRKQSFLVTV